MWDKATGKGEYENTEPDETFADIGLKADAHAGATLLWGTAEANLAEEAYLGTTNRTDGTSTYTKKTIQIPLETEAQRDIASRTLWAVGIPYMPGLNDGITDTDAIGAPWQINQIAKDFGNLSRESGFMWDENYSVDTSENGFDVGFEAGVALGGSGKWNNITQKLNSYHFWDGKEMATQAGCAA